MSQILDQILYNNGLNNFCSKSNSVSAIVTTQLTINLLNLNIF